MAEAPAQALRPSNDPQDPCPQTQVVLTLYPLLKVQLMCLGSRRHFPKGRMWNTDHSRGSGKKNTSVDNYLWAALLAGSLPCKDSPSL